MDFMKKFKPEVNTIKEFDHWVVMLREKQVTLGSAIIALKRQVSTMPELRAEEAAELPVVFAWYEDKCKALYGAKKTNYVAAMMKDSFVHFHAFPRYDIPFSKYDTIWEDTLWPKVIEFLDVRYDESVLAQIRADMRT